MNPGIGISPDNLEFEIKLGNVSLNQFLVNDNVRSQEIVNKVTQNQNWEVLPPAKNDKQYSSYFFKPTLKSADPNDKVKNRDAFGYMLKNVKAAANQANTVVIVNKNIKELPVIRQKDVIYSDQTRATYNCTDFKSNEYALEPIVVIKKNRLDDLNIKSATIKKGPGYPTLCSDLRLSCSTENQCV